MTYQELLLNARPVIGKYCKACNECNGKVCKNAIPGPGAKGVGDNAIRNYDKWKEVRLNMDTIYESGSIDTSLEIFGQTFKYPFFAGPVGAVNMHYGEMFDDISYNDILVQACKENGIAAFTGDGVNPLVMEGATKAIKACAGIGVPTIKPWDMPTVMKKLDMAKDCGAFAISMDIDGAGLPFLKNMNPPAGAKSASQLKEIVNYCNVPFIVKGVMTVKGALKAKQAGAAAIVVSNHGGRVLDQCPATAEVLTDIVKAVNGEMKVIVDGGIRSGADVFKAIAMGADAVIVARPFVTGMYGGQAEGVKCIIDKLAAELEDTMAMCGAKSIKEITEDMVFIPNNF